MTLIKLGCLPRLLTHPLSIIISIPHGSVSRKSKKSVRSVCGVVKWDHLRKERKMEETNVFGLPQSGWEEQAQVWMSKVLVEHKIIHNRKWYYMILTLNVSQTAWCRNTQVFIMSSSPSVDIDSSGQRNARFDWLSINELKWVDIDKMHKRFNIKPWIRRRFYTWAETRSCCSHSRIAT